MYFHALANLDLENRADTLAARLHAARPQRKLLVAFDDSPEARCALDFAIERARETGAGLHVVNVQVALIDNAVMYRSYKGAGEEVLAHAMARLDRTGVRYSTEVAFGSVPESIVRSAKMARCDMILIGLRERLAIANFFSASVSARVMRLAHVPVTVVKQKVVATTHAPRGASSLARLRA